jgi:hypothetical protein
MEMLKLKITAAFIRRLPGRRPDEYRLSEALAASGGVQPSAATAGGSTTVIRLRRTEHRLPFVRAYEVEITSASQLPSERRTLRRSAVVRRLEREVGTGDAWAFVYEADRVWEAGGRGWAVEYDPRPGTFQHGK